MKLQLADSHCSATSTAADLPQDVGLGHARCSLQWLLDGCTGEKRTHWVGPQSGGYVSISLRCLGLISAPTARAPAAAASPAPSCSMPPAPWETTRCCSCTTIMFKPMFTMLFPAVKQGAASPAPSCSWRPGTRPAAAPARRFVQKHKTSGPPVQKLWQAAPRCADQKLRQKKKALNE